jgi:hypothetical protein
MNKFLNRISIVGLLLSTSCGYSQTGLPGVGLSAGINEKGSESTLLSAQECYNNYTVGLLPKDCALKKNENKIQRIYNYSAENNAWSADGKTFNIVAVDGIIYEFGADPNSDKIYSANDDKNVLYHKETISGSDKWYKGSTDTDNEVTVLDLTSAGTDRENYELKSDNNNKLYCTLTRDDSYNWPDSTANPKAYLSHAILNFKGETVTLKCATKDTSSTFEVTQFGEVSCSSGSKLILEPNNNVENVLLLEPGSKVGKAAQPTEEQDESLLVEKGIIDLSKYFKNNDSLKQGAKIYLDLSGTGTDTPKIKLFDNNDENLNKVMEGWDSTDAVFKNINLGSSIPSFTQIGTLDFSTLKKLFKFDEDGVDDHFIEQSFIEKVEKANSENPVLIDVKELVGKDEDVIITKKILETLIDNQYVTLTNEDAKDVTLDFAGVSINDDTINLSDMVCKNFAGKITLKGLSNVNEITINVDAGKDVVLELSGNTISELNVQNGATVSVSGTGNIIKHNVSSKAKLNLMPKSNIEFGKSSV